MKLRTLEYFTRETFSSIRNNGLMGFASMSTVALSLLILGLFLILVLNLNHMASSLESQVQITVYLEDSVTNTNIHRMAQEIGGMEGVTKVTLVDKKQAMERFRQRLGEQQGLLSALENTNPLPNSFEIQVDKPERIKALAPKISKMSGVENARFGQEVVEQLFTLTKMLRIGGLILIVFLALAALFIIANTIRLTVFARRKEVSIMKYVGATDWFIRWPFLLEGMVLGLVGAFVAVLLLVEAYGALLGQAQSTLAFLPLIPRQPFLSYVSVVLLLSGMAIGALGSAISLRKFLNV